MGRLAPLFRQIRSRHRRRPRAGRVGGAWPRPRPSTPPRHGRRGHDTAEPGPAGGPGVEGFEEGVRRGRAWRRPAAARRADLPQPDLLADRQLRRALLAAQPQGACRGSARSSRRARSGSPPISTGPPPCAARPRRRCGSTRRWWPRRRPRPRPQIKATQDRLAAEAAQRQAEVDAELQRKLAEAEAAHRRRQGRGAGPDPERRRRGGAGRGPAPGRARGRPRPTSRRPSTQVLREAA